MTWRLIVITLFLTTLQIFTGNNTVFSQHTEINSPMPELKVRNYFGVQFSELDIIEDRNYILFLFNPTCYHCVEMTTMLLEHKEELSETTIFFIASQDMLELLPRFMSEVNYKESPNLIIGVDDSDIVRKLYTYGMLPQIMVYNPQRQLIKIQNGDVTWDEFKTFL